MEDIFIEKLDLEFIVSLAEQLAKHIKECRKNKKLTQKQLAGLSNLSLSYIRRLEKADGSCKLNKALSAINSMGYDLKVKIIDNEVF